MSINDLWFPLNRPEYPKNPEVLQSALAWSLDSGRQPTERGKGLIYEEKTKSGARTVEIVQSRPSEEESNSILSEMQLSIGSRGHDSAQLHDSLWNGLRAVTAQKAKAYSPVPLTAGMAMLQDAIGVHAKAGPPNFAEIIEQVYRGGAREPVQPGEAARRWYSALSSGDSDRLLEFLDLVAARLLELRIGRNPLTSIAGDGEEEGKPACAPPAWLSRSRTPMNWFHDSWNTLCTAAWREALPAQRWSDWASCVLRTGVALTFLWEARFFQQLGRFLLSPNRDPVVDIICPQVTLLRWRASGLPITVRDENSRLIKTVLDGTRVRIALDEILSSHRGDPTGDWQSEDGLSDFLGWFTRDAPRYKRFCQKLSACYGGGKFAPANNVLETIRYLLLARSESGHQADFYGLLRRRSSRFLVVSPGEEWIVVAASLAAGSPGARCTLGTLRSSLASLGVYAERDEVITELERAGLSRSSHDADDAIVVWSGF